MVFLIPSLFGFFPASRNILPLPPLLAAIHLCSAIYWLHDF